MLADWAVMQTEDGIAVNYYGPATFSLLLASGQELRLDQETQYPCPGCIRLTLALEAPERLALRLRIPHWSAQTEIRVNGEAAPPPPPGRYLALDREWRSGDTIELSLDMGLRVWAGEREFEGKASLFRGPLLLAYDPRFDMLDPRSLPTFGPTRLQESDVPWRLAPQPLLLRKLSAAEGQPVVLCDFASAGAAGTPYLSWLSLHGATPQPFKRANPSRTRKIGWSVGTGDQEDQG